ncbi:type II toxin-antitoxin system RelB/ParD family antitoxin [Lactococcus termiticola]|uniref:Uncharacterized protein n=1 Tax=Lactococcus termiticola TaxID=2169526 RepID=A0A2R5HJB2_9LACT|nr:acyl-ACP desaturase [Lactococcus termiticola]GBG96291.1 hypothetical protein NtB2_00402 [Lactococcus termiticola]
MTTLVKDKLYNFRTNAAHLEEAKAIMKKQDVELSAIFNEVIEQIILTKKSPIKSKEEIEAELFLDELDKTLNSRLDKILAGEYMTESEVRERLGL